MQECPYCGQLNSDFEDRCVYCGELLYIQVEHDDEETSNDINEIFLMKVYLYLIMMIHIILKKITMIQLPMNHLMILICLKKHLQI